MESSSLSLGIPEYEKCFRNSPLFTLPFSPDLFFSIAQFFNIIQASKMTKVCRKFRQLINENLHRFTYLNCLSSYVPNIFVLKLIQKYPRIRVFMIHNKVTTAELARFLEIMKDSVEEFETKESVVDFAKLFRSVKLLNLWRFTYLDSKKPIDNVDIRALVKACPNIRHLDLSNIPSINNNLFE